MPIYIDTKTVREYVLKADRKLPEADQVKFRLRAPSLGAQTRFQQALVDGASEGAETATIPMALVNEILTECLVGWSEWKNGSESIAFAKSDSGAVTEESLAQLGMANRIELAGNVLNSMTLGSDAKE